MKPRFVLLLLPGLMLTACAAPLPQASQIPHGNIRFAVCKRGWHTEIALPDSALTGPLAQLSPAPVHRHYLLIGFGARAYFTSPTHHMGDGAEALFPGPSAIGLAETDVLEEPDRQITWLSTNQAGINQMLNFTWASLPHQGSAPAPIAAINNTNMFYAATPDYNMFYNCNNWAVDLLRAGGMPFSNTGLHYSSDVQAEAQRIAALQGN